MLAIQKVKMCWEKDNRTSKSSIQREKYYRTMKIEESVELSGQGIFIKENNYIQIGNAIYSSEEYQKICGNRWINARCVSEKEEQEEIYVMKLPLY